LDDMGFREPKVAASDGRFNSERDGLPKPTSLLSQ
jgi:hypothetical protein